MFRDIHLIKVKRKGVPQKRGDGLIKAIRR